MPFTLKLFCFLLALLPLSVLGHDLYVCYLTNNDFSFSAFGYLLKTYAPEQHRDLILYAGREVFDSQIAPLLEIRAFPALLGAVSVFYGFLIVLWILGIWPFNQSMPTTSSFSRTSSGERGGEFRYKRK